VTAVAAFVAWLGGAVILLADGRRGLALGLGVVTVAIAGLAFAAGQDAAAIALGAGGAATAALRLRSGPRGWGLMQPGSTPRIILAIVIGIGALYFAASVSTGDDTALRFAWLVVLALSAARLLDCEEPATALTAAAALALGIGAVASLPPAAEGLPAAIVAGLVAAGISALPEARPDGA
jgi:hypothetical protein